MFLIIQIQNEIGRCKPITAAYTGLHISFCSETLDGLVSATLVQTSKLMQNFNWENALFLRMDSGLVLDGVLHSSFPCWLVEPFSQITFAIRHLKCTPSQTVMTLAMCKLIQKLYYNNCIIIMYDCDKGCILIYAIMTL